MSPEGGLEKRDIPKAAPKLKGSPKTPDKNDQKYSPEAIKAEVEHKSKIIRAWAAEKGLKEGKDFRVVQSVEEAGVNKADTAPHELKQFYVLISEEHYDDFAAFILGSYKAQRQKENPEGNVSLLYSWGGRFVVINDGVFFDSAPMLSISPPRVRTFHNDFNKFFRERTGFDLPNAALLNGILKNIAHKGIDTYRKTDSKLEEMKNAGNLPKEGYRALDGFKHALMALEAVITPRANPNEGSTIDLPEIVEGNMPIEMRRYCDLTYNMDCVQNLDPIIKVTGIDIPDELRVDKIYEHNFHFDRNKIIPIRKEFADFLRKRKDSEKADELLEGLN